MAKSDNPELFTAYVTKYALTSGIIEVEVEHDPIRYPNMVSVGNRVGMLGVNFYGSDWHRTKEEALVQVEKMVLIKLRSLNKSLQKMENLLVSPPKTITWSTFTKT